MKRDKRLFELASQTRIRIDLFRVCFIYLNMQIKKRVPDHL